MLPDLTKRFQHELSLKPGKKEGKTFFSTQNKVMCIHFTMSGILDCHISSLVVCIYQNTSTYDTFLTSFVENISF